MNENNISWWKANFDHQHYCSTSAPSQQHQQQLGPQSYSSNTKRSRTKLKKATADKSQLHQQSPLSSSSTALPSSSQANNSSLDCFRQFYLQRQSDGSLVIIPVVSNTIVTTTTTTNDIESRREKESNNIGKPVRSSSCRTASTAFDCTTTIQANITINSNNNSVDTLTTRANYNPTTKSRKKNNNCYKSSRLTQDNFSAKPNMQIVYHRTGKNKKTTPAANMVYDLSKQNSINLILQSGGGKMMIDHNLGGDKQGQTFIGQMMVPANNTSNGHYKTGNRTIINILKHEHTTTSTPINILTSPPPIVSSSTSSASNNKGQQQQQQLAETNTFLFDNNSTIAREQNFSSLPPVNTIFNDCLISPQTTTMNNTNNASIQDNNNNCDLGRSVGPAGSFTSAAIINNHHIDFFNPG